MIFSIWMAYNAFQTSYTPEGAIEWLERSSMNVTLTNNVTVGFYGFSTSKFEHFLITGDLDVNDSCHRNCKSFDNHFCENGCITFKNLTMLGNRKSINHDVIAFSPIVCLMYLFIIMIPIVISPVCLYILSPKFGALGLWFPKMFTNEIEWKWYFYYPLIILSLPLNMVCGILLIYLVPVKTYYLFGKYLFQHEMRTFLQLKEIKIFKINISFRDIKILSMTYLIVASCFYATIFLYQLINYNSYVSNVWWESWYFFINCSFMAISTIFALIMNGNFNIIVIAITSAIQILTPLWGHVDTILDILQTNKYYDLSKSNDLVNHLSEKYFLVSVTSFIIPVFLTLLLQIRNRILFDLFNDFHDNFSNKIPIDGHYRRIILRVTFQVLIIAPAQIMLALVDYFLAIPYALLKEGVNKIRFGEDENRLMTFGLFTNKKSVNCLPLYAGLEPLGEASIQTFLSLTFLINHWDFAKNDDYILGVKFPISIISMIFSCVSLVKGLWGVIVYFKTQIKERHARTNTLIYSI